MSYVVTFALTGIGVFSGCMAFNVGMWHSIYFALASAAGMTFVHRIIDP